MATKAEIIERLKEFAIPHDINALKADLEALLPPEGAAPAPTPTDVPRETSAEQPTQDAKATASSDDVKAVIVLDPHGHPHRTYSLEVHGETFRELAEKYVSARPGWSLKP